MSNLHHQEKAKITDSVPFRILLYSLVFYSVLLPDKVITSDNCKSLFASCNVDKQAEGRNNVGALNRAQQAYHLEQQKFGNTMAELGLGIQTESTNYSYRILQPMAPVSDWKQPQKPASWSMTIGQAKHKGLPSYLGFAWSLSDPTTKEMTTRVILCEQNRFLPQLPPNTMPKMINGQMQCPPNNYYRQFGN